MVFLPWEIERMLSYQHMPLFRHSSIPIIHTHVNETLPVEVDAGENAPEEVYEFALVVLVSSQFNDGLLVEQTLRARGATCQNHTSLIITE